MKEITSQIAVVAKGYLLEHPPAWLAFLEDQITEFLRLLAFLLNKLSLHMSIPTDSRPASYVIIGLFWLLMVLLILLLIWQYQKRFAGRKALSNAVAVENSRPLSFSYWLGEADAQSAQGDFRQASCSLYFALLCFLHEEGIVTFAPAKTNQEYQSLLSGRPELEACFARIVFVQEEAFFGRKAIASSTYETCRELLFKVQREYANNREEKPS